MVHALRGYLLVFACAIGLFPAPRWTRAEPPPGATAASSSGDAPRDIAERWAIASPSRGASGRTFELNDIPRVEVQPVDAAEARRVDAVDVESGLPPRFAVERPITVDPEHDGLWEERPDGGALWSLRITSPGARSLSIALDRFQLPPGGSLLVYSTDGRRELRPFTDRDNESHGQLWTPPVLSDDIVVELRLAGRHNPFALRIAAVHVGYRGFGSDEGVAGGNESGECNVDVACPPAAAWRDPADAVGLITIGGTRYCSGVMLNNTARDRRPLFLTAAHCGVTPQNAASVVVFWKYENSFCRPPDSPGSGGLGDGVLDRFQTGASLRAASPFSDFALLELDDDPDPLWGVTFAGWDRSLVTPAFTAVIHHPETNEKRISFDEDAPTVTTYLAFPSPGNGSHWRIADWDLGTTEPGSSGGPLFNQDQRVIGQLHGGQAACGNDASDWFGRLAIGWEGGGAPSTRLRDWLDPLTAGPSFMDHLPGRGLGVTPTRDARHVGPVGGPFSDAMTVYTLSNSTDSIIAYRVSGPEGGWLSVRGEPGPLEGELPPGGVAYVEVALNQAVAALESGVHESELTIDDLSNGMREVRRHVLEAGQTAFEIAPPEGMDWSAPKGGPLWERATYQVVSARPTPVTVRVTSSVPWLWVNGQPGPVDILAATMGLPVPVELTLAPSASELPIGVYAGEVAFESLSGGVGDTTRAVRFEVGRATYRATDVPLPLQDFGSVASRIVVLDDWCVADLDVSLDARHTYAGDLIVRLQSPRGTIVTLHNRSGESSDDLLLTYDDDGASPDGPGSLGDFLLESSAGTWTLFASDNSADDTGTLRGWALRIRPLPGGCPARGPAVSFSFDANPGWTTQGGWQFGTPTGQGSNSKDPTSGFTGVNVYGYNLNGDYPNNLTGPRYLTSRAIDCSHLVFTQLRFRRWLGIESAQFDRVNIEASRDGVNWRTLWEHNTPAAIRETAWSLQAHDLSRIADGARTLYLRWGLGPTDGSQTYAGWNIDDVEIWGVPAFSDCNRNGAPDLDDLVTGRSGDCDGNGAPDECDIDDGRSEDCNEDGVPDQCQCMALQPPQAEPGGAIKNRYLSLVPPRGSCPSALLVTLTRLPASHAGREGLSYWVGEPTAHEDGSSDPAGFRAAALRCAPLGRIWDDIGVLHVHGPAVVPGAEYEVRTVHAGCFEDGPFPGDYSEPLVIATAPWGDVLNPTVDGHPTFADVAAVIRKFQSAAGALHKTCCQLHPDALSPGASINFLDVAHALDAFGGGDYPFPGPAPCP